VQVVTKIGSARRFPQHGYPVVCLKLQPREGTRIQQLPYGSGGLDVLLTHVEVAQFPKSLNRADKKANYRWEPVAEKPAARKARLSVLRNSVQGIGIWKDILKK
jgi:hypothetical protein